MRKLFLLLPVALLFVMLPAYGANLVVNPGFETGSLSGWTTSSVWNVNTTDPHTGNDAGGNFCFVSAATCLNPNTGSWIQQTLTTVALTTYTLTFWLDPNNFPFSSSVEIDAYWNGVKVGAFASEPSPYHLYTVSGLVASSTSTVLEFTGYDSPGEVWIDDVDVEANASGVPEPLSFMLSGLGLAFLGLVRARRAH